MEKLREYLQEKGLVGEILQGQLDRFERNQDILAEWLSWLETGDFADRVVVEGYRASELKKLADFLDGVGVYDFLITLREEPELGKKYIAEGFVVE